MLKILRFPLIPVLRDPPVFPLKILIFSLLLLAEFGCSSASSSKHAEATSLPADLRIIIGEGGGFSGLWSGYSIRASIPVFEWKGTSLGENPIFAGTLPHDSLSALWQAARDLHLLEQPSKAVHANYVQALAIATGGAEHLFQWEPSISPDGSTAPAVAFRARCLSTIRTSLHP